MLIPETTPIKQLLTPSLLRDLLVLTALVSTPLKKQSTHFAVDKTNEFAFAVSAGVSLIIFPLFLRLKPREGHILQKIKSIDYTGTFLYTTSATGFLIAISWGGIMFSWSSWHTLVPFILGLFGLACFVLYDVRVATAPLIPFRIFASRTAAVGYYQITINGMAMWAVVYYLPLYFEGIKGYSPLITGVALFPDTLLVAPVAAITGGMIEKFGKYQKILWVGWFLATFGFGLMIYLRESTTIPQWIFLNCVAGIGMGLTLPSMQYQCRQLPEMKIWRSLQQWSPFCGHLAKR
jgi:hypothetical protein